MDTYRRKFDGVIFTREGYYATDSEAQEVARRYRRRGWYARVMQSSAVSMSGAALVYIRRK